MEAINLQLQQLEDVEQQELQTLHAIITARAIEDSALQSKRQSEDERLSRRRQEEDSRCKQNRLERQRKEEVGFILRN